MSLLDKELARKRKASDRQNLWARTTARGRMSYYKRNAKKFNRAWQLPWELFEDLVTDYCFYCGAGPEPLNGVDRVNTAGDYVEGNVVTACTACNLAKKDMPRQEFESWIARAAAHQAKFAAQGV